MGTDVGAAREYIDQAPIAFFVVDTDGAFVDVNPAATELLGYTRSAFRSMSVEDLQPTEGTDQLSGFEILEQTGTFRGEQRLQHSNGSEVVVLVDAVTLEDGRGLVYCQDVTERQTWERGLEESEARYRSMARALDTSGVGTFILDAEFTVVWLNKAIEEFFGVDRAALVGTDKAAQIQSDIKHIFEEPETFAEEVLTSYEENNHVRSFTCHVMPTADREERWLLHWSTPIEDGRYAGGRIEHYTDITETVAYEQQLEQQRDSLHVLNEVLRHDIRNDLQLVTTYADALQAHVDEEGEQYLDRLRKGATQAVQLTNTARETADMMVRTDKANTPVAIRSVLEREVTECRTSYPDAEITVAGDIPDVRVRANDMLGSVFRNLIQNAVQHNDAEEPMVTLRARTTAERLVVEVADNGSGIPEGQEERIFEANWRGTGSQGTGLGLFLVRTLVESYDGEVRIDPDDTEGTTVIVELRLLE